MPSRERIRRLRRRVREGFGILALALALATGSQAQTGAGVPLPPELQVDLTFHDGDFTLPQLALPAMPVFDAAQAPAPQGSGPVLAVPAIPDIAPAVDASLKAMPLALRIEARLAAGDQSWPRRLPRREREAIAAFYAARGHAPLWIGDKRFEPAGEAVLARLARAGEDALNPADYVAPRIDVLPPGGGLDVLADAEIRLSALAVLYARDARGGRIEPSRLSNLITPDLRLPGAADVLPALAASSDPGARLATFNPVHPGYAALREALAELRARRPDAPVSVPRGRALKVGMSDPRVPLVRARFGLGPTEDAADIYDERIASAVAEFQKKNGLPASGVLTDRTVSLLSGPPAARSEARLIANMERWRWLPDDLGARHILVNIPEFSLRLVEDGAVRHTARVIVGKTETPTPIFSGEMSFAVVNPSWYIPPSIMKNEILPGLARDPNYAAARGYEVVRRGNQISVRQPPGERNALGFIKFMFPNRHAVYLHDTPNRRLFGAERRAFSHGCVRVDQPFRLADFVFGETWSEPKLKALIGKGERTLKLAQSLPVHLVYFTLQAEEGAIRVRDDLYGVDGKIAEALGLRG